MAVSYKGKSFSLCLLLIFVIFHISKVYANTSSSNLDEQDHMISHIPNKVNDLNVVNQQEIQIEKLEELVKNLTELVSRLESWVSESPKIGAFDGNKNPLPVKVKVDKRKREDGGLAEKVEDDGSESNVRDGERVGAVSVTKHSLFWSERFQFVAAVKLDSNAMCVSVLPLKDLEGLSKYVAVGDDQGRVYVFSRNGDVLLEFYTLSNSPVTTMLTYMSPYKNESVLVTGHGNGVILVHRIWEVSSGEEWNTLGMETNGKFVVSEIEEGGSPITILEVHHVGRTRYILSTDVSGKIKVFRENGSVHGLAVPSSRPLVFLKQRLLFLTETGAGSLDLRTMKIRESDCEGLNNSVARNYVFDATERSKAYGFTSEGDLIHVLLLGDIMNFKCRIRSMKKFDVNEPLAFQAIKGYLLVVSQEKVFVYNVSSPNYIRAGGPRLLFSAGLDEIVASFLNYQAMELDAQKKGVVPLIASDHEKLVILSLGSGYVGMYRSNLPIYRGEFNTILWSSPVLFFILFIFGAWKFFANKKEAYSLWGPEDHPFTSNGAPLGSGSGDRSFIDSSSTELRGGGGGGGLRGPTRRYGSPSSRYPGGTASTSSYRPNSAAEPTNSRPAASVDPNFRTSELKFRGANLESTAYPKRRESSLYVNTSPVVDETN